MSSGVIGLVGIAGVRYASRKASSSLTTCRIVGLREGSVLQHFLAKFPSSDIIALPPDKEEGMSKADGEGQWGRLGCAPHNAAMTW